jgi:acetylornithine deacetylase/succinyl-diaminopimelate desuccinylase-like protein
MADLTDAADPDEEVVRFTSDLIRIEFSGEVRDGCVWGRGAIDMDGMVAMMLALARDYARSGRRPARDVVLAFTADEEAEAAFGSDWLVRHRPDQFEGCTEGISESGAYTFHAGDGVRIYPVGAGERGTAWLRLDARGTAGHGSRTNHDNAVGALASAVARLYAHRWPVRLTPTTRAALTGLAEALGVDADLDGPAGVDATLERLGPAARLVGPTVRSSPNPTMPEAGYKVNVIPGSATARVDGRVLPGDEDEFERTLDRLTGASVEWSYLHREVPLEAPVDTPTYAAMRAALLAEDPGAHVVPVCLSGGTDAKQFSRLEITGYGFAPLLLPEGFDYHALFHGVDEWVPVAGLRFGVRVLDRFLQSC